MRRENGNEDIGSLRKIERRIEREEREKRRRNIVTKDIRFEKKRLGGVEVVLKCKNRRGKGEQMAQTKLKN